MKSTKTIVILIIMSMNVYSQFYCDTVKGYVGDYINLPIHYIYNNEKSIDHFKITGSILISNPTVFFPNQFITTKGNITQDTKITQINDSLYQFELGIGNLAIAFPVDTVTFYLSGELLAGYDTVSYLNFFDVKIDDKAENNFYDTVYSFTKVPELRYIRLARLYEGIPNPVWQGSSITWNYNIDKPSDVIFKVYTISGAVVFEKKIYSLAGFQQFTLMFDNTYSAGFYFISISTNSGDDFKSFVFLK